MYRERQSNTISASLSLSFAFTLFAHIHTDISELLMHFSTVHATNNKSENGAGLHNVCSKIMYGGISVGASQINYICFIVIITSSAALFINGDHQRNYFCGYSFRASKRLSAQKRKPYSLSFALEFLNRPSDANSASHSEFANQN